MQAHTYVQRSQTCHATHKRALPNPLPTLRYKRSKSSIVQTSLCLPRVQPGNKNNTDLVEQKNLSAFTIAKSLERTFFPQQTDSTLALPHRRIFIQVYAADSTYRKRVHVCSALEMCYGVWLCVYSSCVNQLEANKSRVVRLCGNSREGSRKGSDASLLVSLWWETINNKQPVSERTPRFRPQLRTAILSRLKTKVADTQKKSISKCRQWMLPGNIARLNAAMKSEEHRVGSVSVLWELKPTDSGMPIQH